MKPEAKKLLWHLVINTILLVVLYFLLIALKFHYISIIYLLIGGGLGMFYVIYNRGFSRKGVTPEMLPDTMSYEEKIVYIEDGKKRLKDTRWVLTLLIPIIVTLCLDVIYVFILPMLGFGG